MVIVRKPEKRSGESKLGEPRLELIHLWLPPPEDEESDELVETAEAVPEAVDDQNVVPISKHQVQGSEAAAAAQPAIEALPAANGVPANEAQPDYIVEPVPVPVEAPAAPEPTEAEPGAAEAPRPRGRPRRHVKRRQVHFHVDPAEDELLLEAARQHGSQQKGLIAALRALQEIARLRDEVDRLKRQSERQQQLLVAARSLLDK